METLFKGVVDKTSSAVAAAVSPKNRRRQVDEDQGGGEGKKKRKYRAGRDERNLVNIAVLRGSDMPEEGKFICTIFLAGKKLETRKSQGSTRTPIWDEQVRNEPSAKRHVGAG